MDLSKIISITGKSGLYRVVAQGRQALIAESLTDKKRIGQLLRAIDAYGGFFPVRCALKLARKILRTSS